MRVKNPIPKQFRKDLRAKFEAIAEVLEDRGIITKQELKDRVQTKRQK